MPQHSTKVADEKTTAVPGSTSKRPSGLNKKSIKIQEKRFTISTQIYTTISGCFGAKAHYLHK
jgi:hypothetical protein